MQIFQSIWNSAILIVILLSLQFYSVYLYNSNRDAGEPLFLTPFLKTRRFGEARRAARFPAGFFRGKYGYSGFLTIDERYNSNTFFLYLPSIASSKHAPIIIWLDGGPSVTSLSGLFIQNGPVLVSTDGKVLPRKYSWNEYCNVIYIDNPVGTGYSFTDDEAGYTNNIEQVAQSLYEAVKQLHMIFPELQQSPLYVAGSSYGGKFASALTYTIHQAQRNMNQAPGWVNLTGLILASAVQNTIIQLQWGQHLYDVGLLDESGLETFLRREADLRDCLRQKDTVCATSIVYNLIADRAVNSPGTVFHNLTGFTSTNNFLTGRPVGSDPMMKLILSPSFRRLVHVGNKYFGKFNTESKVILHLENDYACSAAPWTAEILNHYKVLAYHGQVDIYLPFKHTVQYYDTLPFDGAETFRKAKRHIWRVDNEVVGYVKEGGNLLQVFVNGAGHIIGQDKPKALFDILKRYLGI